MIVKSQSNKVRYGYKLRKAGKSVPDGYETLSEEITDIVKPNMED